MRKIIIILTFIWIGFVCAISFMESWLKFQALNMTTKLSLGVGKLVFGALNKVEITFAVIIIIILAVQFKKLKAQLPYTFSIIILIVMLQSFWLLPALSERATQIIQDIHVPKSNLHIVFVVLEIIKVTCLFIFGIRQLNMRNTL